MPADIATLLTAAGIDPAWIYLECIALIVCICGWLGIVAIYVLPLGPGKRLDPQCLVLVGLLGVKMVVLPVVAFAAQQILLYRLSMAL